MLHSIVTPSETSPACKHITRCLLSPPAPPIVSSPLPHRLTYHIATASSASLAQSTQARPSPRLTMQNQTSVQDPDAGWKPNNRPQSYDLPLA